MKKKRIPILLLVGAVAFGTVVPQSVLPIGMVEAKAEESISYSIEDAVITFKLAKDPDERYYTGKAQGPNVNVVLNGQTLTDNTDYQRIYENNSTTKPVDVGTYYVTVRGIGAYTGEQKIEYKIKPVDINDATITYPEISDQAYTGRAIEPFKYDEFKIGSTVIPSTHYTVTYENNTEPGTAYIVITGNDNIPGVRKIPFTIYKKEDISQATVSKPDDVNYDGKEHKPDVTVKIDDTILTKGTDYAVQYTQKGKQDSINAGEVSVDIYALSSSVNYTGSKKGATTFKILPFDISQNVGDAVSVSYSSKVFLTEGGSAEPNPTVSFNGTTLSKGDENDACDYTVTYHNNDKPGTATMTIKGSGNFTGSITKEFEVIEAVGTVVNDAAAFKEAVEAVRGTTVDNPAEIQLGSDILLDEPITVPEGQYIDIIGYGNTISVSETANCFSTEEKPVNGLFVIPEGTELTVNQVTFDGSGRGRLFYVQNGAKLNVRAEAQITNGRASESTDGNSIYGGQCIYNAGETQFAGTIRDNAPEGTSRFGTVYNAEGATFTMTEEAQIRNVKTTVAGDAIYNAKGGTVKMLGGSIINIKSTNSQGAVFNNGNFYMNDGSISKNDDGGSIIYNHGYFEMNGGEIAENKNTYSAGSGLPGIVYVVGAEEASFKMTGGKIRNNQSCWYGGGVYVESGNLEVSGTAEITNNVASYTSINQLNTSSNGGGVFVKEGNFIMTGGEISGNEAYAYQTQSNDKVAKNGTLRKTNGVIDTSTQLGGGNRAQYIGLGGGVFVDGGTFSFRGGTISGNDSQFDYAADVYIADKNVTNTSSDSKMELSGNPSLGEKGIIYLAAGKSIDIIDTLSGDNKYTIYQQETDFHESDNGGTAIAKYENADNAKDSDGDKFLVYSYDASNDFKADELLTRYSYIKSANGIYPDRAVVDLSSDQFVLTQEVMKVPFNGSAHSISDSDVKVSAKAVYTLSDGSTKEYSAGNAVKYTIDSNSNNTNAGTVAVNVTPNENSVSAYHYTGERSFTFEITPYDLSKTVYQAEGDTDRKPVYAQTDESGNTVYVDENGNEVTVATDSNGNPRINTKYAKEFTVEKDITYSPEDADDKAYEPNVTASVHLGSALKAFDLVEDQDYTVSYEHNTSGTNNDTLKAVITGKGNYEGTVIVDTGIKVKALQTITAADVSKLLTDEPFAIGAKSSDSKAALSYSTSTPGVATVDANGKVTIVGAGTAKITVTASETDTSRPVQKVVTVNVAAKPFTFVDVTDPEDFWYTPIYWAAGEGITTGWADGTFRPWNTCNRAAVVTFLWRYAGRPEPEKMADFKDMTGNSDFDKAISWAQEQGITTGWDDGTFRPWNTCNRAAIMAFFYRFEGSPVTSAENTFNDKTGNAEFDRAIAWGVSQGITTGWDDGTFRPWNSCNRMSTVVFLYRLNENQ